MKSPWATTDIFRKKLKSMREENPRLMKAFDEADKKMNNIVSITPSDYPKTDKKTLIEQVDKELKNYEEMPDYLKIYKKKNQDKAYIPNEIKDTCSIEFNDIVPDSIKEKFLLYLHKKGIHDLKGWNELLAKEGKSKVAGELLDIVKDDPEFSKWSVNAFFKDTLELCLRKNDGSLKNWVVDEAIKQSILDE